MKTTMIMLFLIMSTILVGCGGHGGGLAPSNLVIDPAAPAAPPVIESNFKYGEAATSANGWEALIDTTDSVEEVTIANGWNVEVKYE
ncbi:MAG: hypothetical protein AABY53_10265 [Bdellovibrionota bacterium]